MSYPHTCHLERKPPDTADWFYLNPLGQATGVLNTQAHPPGVDFPCLEVVLCTFPSHTPLPGRPSPPISHVKTEASSGDVTTPWERIPAWSLHPDSPWAPRGYLLLRSSISRGSRHPSPSLPTSTSTLGHSHRIHTYQQLPTFQLTQNRGRQPHFFCLISLLSSPASPDCCLYSLSPLPHRHNPSILSNLALSPCFT